MLNPEDEGRFRSLLEALRGVPLAEATRAVAEGRVVDARTGEVAAWKPAPMVIPVSRRLRGLVDRDDYRKAVAENSRGHSFRVAGG